VGDRELFEVRKDAWVVSVAAELRLAHVMTVGRVPQDGCAVLAAAQASLEDPELKVDIRPDPWFRELAPVIQLFWAVSRELPSAEEWAKPRVTCEKKLGRCECF